MRMSATTCGASGMPATPSWVARSTLRAKPAGMLCSGMPSGHKKVTLTALLPGECGPNVRPGCRFPRKTRLSPTF